MRRLHDVVLAYKTSCKLVFFFLLQTACHTCVRLHAEISSDEHAQGLATVNCCDSTQYGLGQYFVVFVF